MSAPTGIGCVSGYRWAVPARVDCWFKKKKGGVLTPDERRSKMRSAIAVFLLLIQAIAAQSKSGIMRACWV